MTFKWRKGTGEENFVDTMKKNERGDERSPQLNHFRGTIEDAFVSKQELEMSMQLATFNFVTEIITLYGSLERH